MTLQEWTEDVGYDVMRVAGSMTVRVDLGQDGELCEPGCRAMLHNLSDYEVTKTDADIVYLAPREVV